MVEGVKAAGSGTSPTAASAKEGHPFAVGWRITDIDLLAKRSHCSDNCVTLNEAVLTKPFTVGNGSSNLIFRLVLKRNLNVGLMLCEAPSNVVVSLALTIDDKQTAFNANFNMCAEDVMCFDDAALKRHIGETIEVARKSKSKDITLHFSGFAAPKGKAVKDPSRTHAKFVTSLEGFPCNFMWRLDYEVSIDRCVSPFFAAGADQDKTAWRLGYHHLPKEEAFLFMALKGAATGNRCYYRVTCAVEQNQAKLASEERAGVIEYCNGDVKFKTATAEAVAKGLATKKPFMVHVTGIVGCAWATKKADGGFTELAFPANGFPLDRMEAGGALSQLERDLGDSSIFDDFNEKTTKKGRMEIRPRGI